MSKDGMTDRERAAGCTISDVMPEGVERVTGPDQIEREIKNRMCSHHFKNGKCKKCGITVAEFDAMPDYGGSLALGSYLSQDASNQFRSIFFKGGDYSRPGLVITDLDLVGAVVLRGTGGGGAKYIFMVRTGKGEVKFEYGSNDEAQADRTKLLMQIENYHSGGRG
jgi:hypothetical protein